MPQQFKHIGTHFWKRRSKFVWSQSTSIGMENCVQTLLTHSNFLLNECYKKIHRSIILETMLSYRYLNSNPNLFYCKLTAY